MTGIMVNTKSAARHVRSIHWGIALAACAMLAVLWSYGARLERVLAAPFGAMGMLYAWTGLLGLAHVLAARGLRLQIHTTWASYLVAAFVLRQLLIGASLSPGAGEGVGLIALGLADIVWRRESAPRRVLWVGQGLVLAFLLGTMGWLRATAVDRIAVTSSWPARSWNEPTLRAWFDAQPRVAVHGQACPVLLFVDYQCPPCAQVHREYGDRLRVPAGVCLLDYPLEPECNPYVPEAAHELACELAVLIRLTREIDPALAERRAGEIFGASVSRRYVQLKLRELGVQGPDDPHYQKALRAIRDDVDLGRRLGVEATPTFIVNGTRVPGALAPEVYDRILAFSTAREGSAAGH